jgi:hypothetical protein
MDVVLPWRHADTQAQPLAEIVDAGVPVPVALWGWTSTEEQQDPTLSLPRQLRSSRQALPEGFVIVAHFYDVESVARTLTTEAMAEPMRTSTFRSPETAVFKTCSPRQPAPIDALSPLSVSR